MPRLARPAALAALVLALSPAFAPAAPVPGDKAKTIDLVLCLDVSGSMDGLIESAKIRMWDVVNELAKAKPTPNLRVSLYSYGTDTYDPKTGWVRKEIDLSTDLDEVYAKLNKLRTGGGTELVARVTQTAIKEQKWSDTADALKVVFVCGNEPADQDKDVSLSDVAALAKKSGIVINTIYCNRGQASTEAAGWSDFAALCGGKYASINQEAARTDFAANIKAPQDEKLLELSGKLNKTYIAYGGKGKEAAEKQQAQDAAAAAAPGAGGAPQAAVARAEAKANALYRNAAWDLVDRKKEDKEFDVRKLKEDELCDEMKKMTPDERVEFLKKKAEERAAIQKEINDLSAARAKYIAEEVKKAPKNPGEQALDAALKGIIREQATGKGFEFEKK